MDSRLVKRSKALLLKDYLLDDMSSCSSNGFKSFPRRQCCTNVRFIPEINPQIKHKKHSSFHKNTSNSKSPLSAFITAVKRLPFSSAKSPEKKKSSNSFLPRSFSKKILRKSNIWRRKSEREEIRWWTSFNQVVKDDPEPADRSSNSITTRNSKTNSWSESDFTVSDAGDSSSKVNLDLPDESNDVVNVPIEVVNENGVGVTNGDVSTDSTTSSDGTNSSTNTKKQWSSEEKEQFSPVSVLDCPFDDDDDEVSSHFQSRLARMEGTKKKLLKKIQRFECLANLEPVNLGTQFELQPADSSDDNESSSAYIDDKLVSDIEQQEDEGEKALKLLHQMKISSSYSSLKLDADNLLLDFFRERITTRTSESSFHEAGHLEEAEDWINGGNRRELEWGVQKNRQAYVEQMEQGGEWKTLDQENQEVVLELETEVFAGLFNELLMDISSFVTI